MSRQSECAIVQSWASQCQLALGVVAVELHLHGHESYLGLERSGG